MKARNAKYKGKCCDCGTTIKPGDLIGIVRKGSVCCRSCIIDRESGSAGGVLDPEDDGDERAWPPSPSVLAADARLHRRHGISVFRFSSGAVMTQNSRGRCEDAPCCGCCS